MSGRKARASSGTASNEPDLASNCVSEIDYETASDDALRQELRQTQARLEDLTRLVSDWIWEVDRKLCITFVTPRVFEVLGYHPVELVGRPLSDIVGELTPLVIADRRNRPKPFRDHQIRVPDRHGKEHTFLLSAVPIFDETDGRFAGYRGTAQDVTELKIRETALLEAKNAAEEASRTKSEFLAQMSHELRTPLNAIIGFSEIMEAEQLGQMGVPQYRDYAADIANSARHLSQVINDVLDVAKLEAGKLQLREEAVCPQELSTRAIRIVQRRADEAKVTLSLAPIAGDFWLYADGGKLLQILLNLLSNAVKFTPEGGQIEVMARKTQNGGFEFEVADTGLGMSAEEQQIALSPFGQVDSSLARRHDGTGLGLPLSKALVELHQGELKIDSAPKAGTRVTICLPAARLIRPN